MDVLKRTLLIAFYVLVVLAGIAGFLAIRSLRGEVKPIDVHHDTVKVEPAIVKQ